MWKWEHCVYCLRFQSENVVKNFKIEKNLFNNKIIFQLLRVNLKCIGKLLPFVYTVPQQQRTIDKSVVLIL